MPEETGRAEDNRFKVPPCDGFEVFENENGTITIQQEDPMGNDPAIVVVSVERVDLLIKALQHLKTVLLADREPALK